MGLSFFSNFGGRRDQIMVIDLSTRTTKAVHVRRKAGGFALVDYALQEAPLPEPDSSGESLTGHLKFMRRAVGRGTRDTILLIGTEDSTLRNVDVAPMKRGELRRMLQLNTRHFFQEEMSDMVFDCFVPNGKAPNGPELGKGKKPDVLVGMVKRERLDELE